LNIVFFNCIDHKKRIEIRKTIDKLITDFEIIDVSLEEAKKYGEIKHLIKISKKISKENIKKMNIDIMIASTAISHECVIVSGDKIFETISKVCSKLHFENWLINK